MFIIKKNNKNCKNILENKFSKIYERKINEKIIEKRRKKEKN